MKLKIGEGKILHTIVEDKPQEVQQPAQERAHDLNVFPWPFETSSVEEVRIENVLETVNDVVEVMEEIHRICKNGAKVFIVCPYYNSSSSASNPTIKTRFNFATFDYFKKDVVPSYTDKNFKIVNIKGIPHNKFKWIPNFPLGPLVRKRSFVKFRDALSLFVGEINQYLFVELETEK